MKPLSVSIVIPTCRRPGPLALAAGSALAQTGLGEIGAELVIVDNDPQGSAASLIADISRKAPIPVIYAHEPEPGVANARNRGLSVASGALIAFLDDDEEAEPDWLLSLLEAREELGADVVFGPVRGRAPAEVRNHRTYLEAFFSRTGPDQVRRIDGYYGCGNSLLARAALPDPAAPFSPSRNHTGGEDDLLFGQMKAAGAVFGWTPYAVVHEDPAPSRLSLAYTLRRAFAYGQGPCAACAAASPPDRLGVARWMAIGAGQALVFGAMAIACAALAPARFAPALDRAARGLGKVLWWGPFKVSFYGAGAST